MNPDFIEIYDNALPEDFCKEIIRFFENSGQATPGLTGAGVDIEKKRSLDINISLQAEWKNIHQKVLAHTYPGIKQYMEKYFFTLVGSLSPYIPDAKTGQPIALNGENFAQLGKQEVDKLIPALYRYGQINAQKYEKQQGGYPHWHSEIYPQGEQCEPLHRILLFMYYLNDVERGGETEFFYQKKKIQPKTGRMVIAPAGFTHTHRGNQPKSNDKYILTSWILFHRAETLYRQPG
ncbi:MAG: 2OG-Fe(II) oxygenase [Pseudomonadota bacterium]